MAKTAKTRPEAASVAGFLASLPDAQRRGDAEAVLRLMQAATGCEAVMWGAGIVGFDRYRYRYDSGHEGEAPIVVLAAQAGAGAVRHVRLRRVRRALARLGRHSTGKSCLYLKRLSDVDVGVLEELVRASVAEMRRRHPG
ncbi:DUF1801 domain-containing protein [Luteimonas saliphila]|uniref:DUF1801 domain-containing protein n=1 Tax=Luteimonas saliphila TaxID=2804919 RepID=UPI00192D73B0|nr:DUF1801 domain-containing protein [Luteimonas saliphila]